MRQQLAIIAVSMALLAPVARATDYTVETYDFPGALGTGVTGINAAGRIIGRYQLPNTTSVGLRGTLGFTERNGTYTSVGDSTLCRPAGRCLVGLSYINAFGRFAGQFSADVDFPGAFTQSVNSPIAVVQPPGYPNTDILALAGLNDLGEVAGCFDGEFTFESTSFIQFGDQFEVLTLPLADVSGSCVRGLNNLGQLTGTVLTGATPTVHGFILTGNHIRLFDIPADWNAVTQSIQPSRINDLGVVIGTYSDTSGNTHGFVMAGEDLQKIDFPGAGATRPTAINIRGEIVGTYDIATADPAGVQTLPFILKAGVYSTVTLPVPGAVSVGGIDNFGRLFGSYDVHGFVATPKDN